MSEQIVGSLPACRTADRSRARLLGLFRTPWRVSSMQEAGGTTEDQVYGLFSFLLRRPTSELSHTSRVCPTSVRSQSWLSNGCNGLTGFIKPQQFACWAIMGFDSHELPAIAPGPDGQKTRMFGHQLSGESELPIRGATPPLPSSSCYKRKVWPREMLLLWHTGLYATRLLPRRTRVRL